MHDTEGLDTGMMCAEIQRPMVRFALSSNSCSVISMPLSVLSVDPDWCLESGLWLNEITKGGQSIRRSRFLGESHDGAVGGHQQRQGRIGVLEARTDVRLSSVGEEYGCR